MMLGATRNEAQILSSASPSPSLHLIKSPYSHNKHTMTTHDGDTPEALSWGTRDMSLIPTEIRLTFGDPDNTYGSDMAWETVKCHSKATANDFELSLALPSACWRNGTGIISSY